MLGIFARTFMTASRTEPQADRWRPAPRAEVEARLERFRKDERLR
ncbi:hypothetical protein [Citreicella sp. C3M06]|nr:hypothetical protein [Citreicella sp. C3M06]